LDGSWASRRCESRPYGVHLTRHYQFSDMDDAWTSRHNYFSDVSCRHSLYSLDVSGVFSLHDEPSPILDEAYHIDFNVSNQKNCPRTGPLIHYIQPGPRVVAAAQRTIIYHALDLYGPAVTCILHAINSHNFFPTKDIFLTVVYLFHAFSAIFLFLL